MSLFFWRRKDTGKPSAAFTAESAPVAAPPTDEPALPVQRLVHALALRDERAADMRARPDAAHTQLLLAASRELARVGTEPRYTPQRPSLLPQLLEVVHDEEASLRALSRIVAQDPQLTGELLRTANSPLYRVSAAPVESVERATALLGTTGMRTLIATALVRPLTQGGGRLGRFGDITWEHSLYSASAAEAWAARSQDADPFAAHLLALMYGLGNVTVYRVLADLYAAQPGLKADAAVVAGALDTNAAVTAGRVATSWGLSERVAGAAPTGEESPLGHALKFGLTSGAVTLLVRHGRLAQEQALPQLAIAGFTGAQVERIWERLLRAYVDPK
jgi:HD-like signal output (HDOD) protein